MHIYVMHVSDTHQARCNVQMYTCMHKICITHTNTHTHTHTRTHVCVHMYVHKCIVHLEDTNLARFIDIYIHMYNYINT